MFSFITWVPSIMMKLRRECPIFDAPVQGKFNIKKEIFIRNDDNIIPTLIDI